MFCIASTYLITPNKQDSRVVWGYVQFYVCITVSVKVRAESDSYYDYQKSYLRNKKS